MFDSGPDIKKTWPDFFDLMPAMKESSCGFFDSSPVILNSRLAIKDSWSVVFDPPPAIKDTTPRSFDSLLDSLDPRLGILSAKPDILIRRSIRYLLRWIILTSGGEF